MYRNSAIVWRTKPLAAVEAPVTRSPKCTVSSLLRSHPLLALIDPCARLVKRPNYSVARFIRARIQEPKPAARNAHRRADLGPRPGQGRATWPDDAAGDDRVCRVGTK